MSEETTGLAKWSGLIEGRVENLTKEITKLEVTITTRLDRLEQRQQEAVQRQQEGAQHDRKEVTELLERQQQYFLTMLKEDRQQWQPTKYTLAMIIGALILLGYLAKPLLERVLSLPAKLPGP